jgi:hypothetical protein
MARSYHKVLNGFRERLLSTIGRSPLMKLCINNTGRLLDLARMQYLKADLGEPNEPRLREVENRDESCDCAQNSLQSKDIDSLVSALDKAIHPGAFETQLRATRLRSIDRWRSALTNSSKSPPEAWFEALAKFDPPIRRYEQKVLNAIQFWYVENRLRLAVKGRDGKRHQGGIS